MYFDNLTLAGILMVVPYALLPLLFGSELLRFSEDQESSDGARPEPAAAVRSASRTAGCAPTQPCQ